MCAISSYCYAPDRIIPGAALTAARYAEEVFAKEENLCLRATVGAPSWSAEVRE